MALARPTRPVVLVVDDDDGVRAAFTVLLEAHYEVLTASNGPTSLQLLRSRAPDVVLLDIRMPGMGGLEVLARMKEADPQVPVILVTAACEISTAVAGTKLGAEDYITKPFDEHLLLARVREAAKRERVAPPGVLLIGADLGPLAALQLALEEHLRVTSAWGADWGLLARSGAPPVLVILDSGSTPEAAACFLRALHERFPLVAVVLMIEHVKAAMRIPELAALGPGALIEKPYRVADVLSRITALLSARGVTNASWESLGPHVLAAFDYLAVHYDEPIGVADVAAAIGLSADHLAHAFCERLGVAVKGYLERLRLVIGQRLLAETEYKVEDVAERCGFTHASHFSRVFVQHTGVRPGEYRRCWTARVALRG